MNFMEAVKVMKEGKKVKRGDRDIWCLRDDRVICCQNNEVPLITQDYEATDWEIYEEDKKKVIEMVEHAIEGFKMWVESEKKEEKKTLSDKEIILVETNYGRPTSKNNKGFHTEDVKQSLKEFMDYIAKDQVIYGHHPIVAKAKEILGERLM